MGLNTEEVKADLAQLWKSAQLDGRLDSTVAWAVQRIVRGRPEYDQVAATIGCPWWLVGIVHGLECGYRFDRHLHNGDPLTRRTTHVPAGRPAHGSGPFTWQVSAVDALEMKHWDEVTDWAPENCLFLLEQYNGWGYRLHHSDVKSPYLWSGTRHYTRGKYVADGKWDSGAVSKQAGAGAIMVALLDAGLIQAAPAVQADPLRGTLLLDGGSLVCALFDQQGRQVSLDYLGHTLEGIQAACGALVDAWREKGVLVIFPGGAPPAPVAVVNEPWQSAGEYRRGADVKLSANFHLREWTCKCGKCQVQKVDPEMVEKLQRLREKLGCAVRVGSAYRCPSHNAAVGGVKNSTHLAGSAADCTSAVHSPAELADIAESMGIFGGIGRYSTFTHLDNRKDGPARWNG